MKKPLLAEMTLREKIGQCLLVYQWEIYDVDKLGFEADENKLKTVHEKEQFGVLYGDQIGVYFDKANFEKERPFGLDDNQPLQVLQEALEARGMEVYMQRRLTSSAELKKISDNSDLIIYAAYVVGHVPKGGMRLFGEECETYYHAFTHGKEKSIGVSFGYPYIHYAIMENADTFIKAYNASPEAQKAFVEAIFGEIEIVGKSPVKIIPDANSR